jgi:hypothetical protein
MEAVQHHPLVERAIELIFDQHNEPPGLSVRAQEELAAELFKLGHTQAFKQGAQALIHFAYFARQEPDGEPVATALLDAIRRAVARRPEADKLKAFIGSDRCVPIAPPSTPENSVKAGPFARFEAPSKTQLPKAQPEAEPLR